MTTTDTLTAKFLNTEARLENEIWTADRYCCALDRVEWAKMNTPLGRAFRKAADDRFRDARRAFKDEFGIDRLSY